MQDTLNHHLHLLNTKMEESRKLMKDNILLHEQLQKAQADNQRLQQELKDLRHAMTIDHRAGTLTNAEGNRQTKAWIDRLVQEIDICLDALNR
ncbi:MAG: hypothetical protein LAT54_03985 [Cryomorphaceae bacterium]|nr:hypothetical protein [Cryomorphaceae bacterium]